MTTISYLDLKIKRPEWKTLNEKRLSLNALIKLRILFASIATEDVKTYELLYNNINVMCNYYNVDGDLVLQKLISWTDLFLYVLNITLNKNKKEILLND